VQVVRLVHARDRLRRLRQVPQVAAEQVLGRAEKRGQRQLPRHLRKAPARKGKMPHKLKMRRLLLLNHNIRFVLICLGTLDVTT
jgi:hypothetical protein